MASIDQAKATTEKSRRPVVRIDVVSDIIWPFCYVAKAALDKALAFDAIRRDCDVEVRWHPFFIRPARLDDPRCRDGIALGTMGTPAGPYWHYAIGRAKELGIDMSGGVERWPNVLYPHRLLHYALNRGGWRVQHDLQGLIFKAFYSDGIYLGPENLARLAAEVGLDEDKTLSYLRSDEDRAEVKRQGLEWSASGVSGVPYFLINGKFAFSGAQDPRAFVKAITIAARQLCPGDQVSIRGLVGNADLNGQSGTLDTFDARSGRWHVLLDYEEVKAVKPTNLVLRA